jgi:hypothetical protein
VLVRTLDFATNICILSENAGVILAKIFAKQNKKTKKRKKSLL